VTAERNIEDARLVLNTLNLETWSSVVKKENAAEALNLQGVYSLEAAQVEFDTRAMALNMQMNNTM